MEHDVPRRRAAAVVAAAWILGAAACSPATSTAGPTSAASAAAQATPAPTTLPTLVATSAGATQAPATLAYARNPAPYVEGATYVVTIDPANFVPAITNPWFPMVQGASFVFDGDEHVEVEVLPDATTILGVVVTLVRDSVFQDGVLVEATLDYYAEDVDGNVWYFGESTAEYEYGKISSTAGSWEAGADGALPGIIMLADPVAGDTYRQEFLQGEAEDLGEVTALSGSVSVPFGSWSGTDVLVTEEWTPLEPDVRERKTYVRGLGVVEVRQIEGGDELVTLREATLPS
jgi:hypothetical protein